MSSCSTRAIVPRTSVGEGRGAGRSRRLPRGADGDLRGPAGQIHLHALQRQAAAKRAYGRVVQRRPVHHVAGGSQAGHHHHLRLSAERRPQGSLRQVLCDVLPGGERRPVCDRSRAARTS
ncbi:unnamed protein product [Leptidea sinapis]|uniref:Uncharacterized protein n=1 Tax=Leptidea sinapis TaxID=189913 RepID=A0A5E4QEF8_9NEOP|nr:unnamed protein product [Leptidea sinapis]